MRRMKIDILKDKLNVGVQQRVFGAVINYFLQNL